MAHTPIHENPQMDEGLPPERTVHQETVIPVLQEELDVHTRRVETGRGVRVTKKVEEREVTADEPLTADHVEVERVALNQPVAGPVDVRYEGDTMIVPVLEEVLVVEKRLILKEEIRITRRRTEFHAPQQVSLRREVAEVERIGEADARAAGLEQPQLQGSAPSADTLLDDKRREQEELRRRLERPPAPGGS